MKTSQAKEPKNSIKVGDIYQLGSHLLACGDARDFELIAKLMGIHGEKVKTILTDPPYGVAYVEGKQDLKGAAKGHQHISNDHLQSQAEYRQFTSAWMEAVKPYLESKITSYIFNSDKMLFGLRDGMIDAGFHFSQLMIWVKNQSIVGRMDYMPQHELIAYGWHGKHEFLKSKDKSILTFPKPNKSALHPTMKPVGLLRRLILNSARIGDVVYDPFGGSGSTLVAAEHTKRKCLMVEVDPHYCQIIMDRFQKLTGIPPKKLTP